MSKEKIHLRDGENYFAICGHLTPTIVTKEVAQATCDLCLVTRAIRKIAIVVALDREIFRCKLPVTGEIVSCWEDPLSDAVKPHFIVQAGEVSRDFDSITSAAHSMVELCGWRAILLPDEANP